MSCRRHGLLLLALLLAACRSTAPVTPVTPAAALPTTTVAAPGSVTYRVDPAASELRVLVYRSGALAALGHNHVLVSHAVEGAVYWHPESARTHFALSLPVIGFSVDPAAARHEEGADFRSTPDARAIAGTRANLLGPQVLDAARFPLITVHSVTAVGPGWQPEVTAAITLHGVTRQLTLPVAVTRDAERLQVTGHFTLRQSDFGITPFTALGGALRVRDALTVRFRLLAHASDARARVVPAEAPE